MWRYTRGAGVVRGNSVAYAVAAGVVENSRCFSSGLLLPQEPGVIGYHMARGKSGGTFSDKTTAFKGPSKPPR